eukprot:scaffold99924_cov22-Tisochrysis_lutea.AAC.2
MPTIAATVAPMSTNRTQACHRLPLPAHQCLKMCTKYSGAQKRKRCFMHSSKAKRAPAAQSLPCCMRWVDHRRRPASLCEGVRMEDVDGCSGQWRVVTEGRTPVCEGARRPKGALRRAFSELRGYIKRVQRMRCYGAVSEMQVCPRLPPGCARAQYVGAWNEVQGYTQCSLWCHLVQGSEKVQVSKKGFQGRKGTGYTGTKVSAVARMGEYWGSGSMREWRKMER